MRIRDSISFLSLSSGIVPLTAMASRYRAGRATVAASMALLNQGRHSLSSYSRNGENSPHPCGPCISATSRNLTPRKLVRVGRVATRSVARRSSSIRIKGALEIYQSQERAFLYKHRDLLGLLRLNKIVVWHLLQVAEFRPIHHRQRSLQI